MDGGLKTARCGHARSELRKEGLEGAGAVL
jgi:hypothetical protein